MQEQLQITKSTKSHKKFADRDKVLSDRPKTILAAVNNAYKSVSEQDMSIFLIDGTSGDYTIAGTNSTDMILSMLKNYSDQGKTHFTYVDIGAGRHGAAKSVVPTINAHQKAFPNIEHVEIVSLSGDNAPSRQYEEGICRISEVSKFKIEEIQRWLKPSPALISAYENIVEERSLSASLLSSLSSVQQLYKSLSVVIDDNDSKWIIGKILAHGIHAKSNILLDEFNDHQLLINSGFTSQDISDDNIRERLNSNYAHIAHQFDTIRNSYQLDATLLSAKIDQAHKIKTDIFEKYITEQKDLDKDKYIEIANNFIQDIQELSINIHNIPARQGHLDNAFAELNSLREIQKMNLPNQIDYATSSWCFRHLVDPAGTLVQTYNLLTPETGIFHGDGFAVGIQYSGSRTEHSISTLITEGRINHGVAPTQTIELLHNLQIPYIVDVQDTGRHRICGFIIAKINNKTLNPQLLYKDINNGEGMDIYSRCVTNIIAAPEWEPYSVIMDKDYCRYSEYMHDTSAVLSKHDMWQYQGILGLEKDTMYRGVLLKSAESGLLINKLKCDGIPVGIYKISSDQYKNLREFIREQYPEMPYDDQSLTISYGIYDAVIQGDEIMLSQLMQEYPDYVNRNVLFIAAEMNDSRQLKNLLHYFETTKSKLPLPQIKQDLFYSALKSRQYDILKMFFNQEIAVTFDNKKKLFNAINSAYNDDEDEKVKGQMIHCLKENFKDDKQTLAEYVHSTRFINEELKQKLNLPGLVISEEKLDKLIQHNHYIEALIMDLGVSRKEIKSLYEQSTLDQLATRNMFWLYRDRVVDFHHISSIVDKRRLKCLTSRPARDLLSNKIISFEELNSIENNTNLELFVESNIAQSIKDGICTLSDIKNLDTKKLEIITQEWDEILYLIEEKKLSFDQVVDLSKEQIELVVSSPSILLLTEKDMTFDEFKKLTQNVTNTEKGEVILKNKLLEIEQRATLPISAEWQTKVTKYEESSRSSNSFVEKVSANKSKGNLHRQ